MNDDRKKYKFALLGGDKRQAVVASELLGHGYSVSLFGITETSASGELCLSADKAMEGADFAILPLPVTRDNVYLSSSGERVALNEIVKLAARNKTMLLGGMVPQELIRICEAAGVIIRDYYKQESLQMKNALPSAEGALMIAMENTDITVNGMKALVCGYGRIGSILSGILKKLGASVTVAARRDETLCEISLAGFDAVRISGDAHDLRKAVGECDVIFNTVPCVVFNKNVIDGIKHKPIYIEIASSPGGIDLPSARDNGIKTVFAPSIPGKYSPVTAGKYIYETVSGILSERGIIL